MTAKPVAVALAILAVLWFAFDSPSLSCQSRFSWDGKRLEQSAVGFLVHQEMSLGDPMTAQVVLRGTGGFTFRFSPDVRRIRLSSGSHVFYEGAPVASRNGPPGALAIDMYRDENASATWLEVADRCNLRSLLRSFF